MTSLCLVDVLVNHELVNRSCSLLWQQLTFTLEVIPNKLLVTKRSDICEALMQMFVLTRIKHLLTATLP